MHHISDVSTMDMDLGNVDLPNNILKFRYGINYMWCSVVVRSSTFVTLSAAHH